MADTDSTCSIAGCGRAVRARGYCRTHYRRWHTGGDMNAPIQTRQRGEGCSVSGCERKHEAKGLCGLHYGRELSGRGAVRACKTCGADVVGNGHRAYCSDKCKPFCRVSGCERRIMGERDVCQIHYTVLLRTGADDVSFTWAKEKRCAVCGETEFDFNRRVVCSGRCQRLYHRHGGEVPRTSECERCGAEVDLFEKSAKSGRKKRVGTLMCGACKRARGTRHGVSVNELFRRDGGACGICQKPIDMGLRYPDPLAPTVDHVWPFALGGTHDIENLQLAHWVCNSRKHADPYWTPEMV